MLPPPGGSRFRPARRSLLAPHRPRLHRTRRGWRSSAAITGGAPMVETRLLQVGEIHRVVHVTHGSQSRNRTSSWCVKTGVKVRWRRNRSRRCGRDGLPARARHSAARGRPPSDPESHRGRDGAMPGLLRDQRMHPLTHAAIGRMALGRGAQLDHVHRLARVHVHVEANAVCHRDGVRATVSWPLHRSASWSAADSSITCCQASRPPASTSAAGSL